MKTRRKIAVVVLGLLVATGTLAGAKAPGTRRDGNALLAECLLKPGSDLEAFYAGGCMAYMRGIIDMHEIYQATLLPTQRLFCLPEDGIVMTQGVRSVLRYLQAHPELLHEPESLLIVMALREAFPCQDTPAQRRQPAAPPKAPRR